MLLPVLPEPEDTPMTSPAPFANGDMDLIGSATSVGHAVDALARHGCLNLTLSINPATLSDYPVATGGYCDVYRGKLYSGTDIAIKSLRICIRSEADDDSRKVLKRAARELYNWSKLRHGNVLSLIGLTVFRGHLSMVSEWMQNGNLMTYRRSNPDMGWIKPCVGICAGLCYIHEAGMVHGDLKAANIMVSSEGVAMVADFGNAQLRDLTLKFTNTTSTGLSLRWTAPELLLQDSTQRSKEADIYAYGVTVLEVVSGKVPYEGFSDERVLFMVTLESKFPPCPQADTSVELWELLTSCWNRDASKGPCMNDINNRLQVLSHSGLPPGLARGHQPVANPLMSAGQLKSADNERDQQLTPNEVTWHVGRGIGDRILEDKEIEDEEMDDQEIGDDEMKGDEMRDDEMGQPYHPGITHPSINATLHPPISRSHGSTPRSVEAMSICSTSVRGGSPYPMSISGMSLRSAPTSVVSAAASVGARPSNAASIRSGYSIPGESRYLQLRPSLRQIAAQRPPQPSSRRRPFVYPALLSRVAEAFRQIIPLDERAKDGLIYPDAFDGREAVDRIAYIVRTLDRNLALLLGRALDAERFFHDLTYEHRLCDSPAEIYQFSALDDEIVAEQPSGVFALLTECYSPTCRRDQLCYSFTCPRRLDVISRGQFYQSQTTNDVVLSPNTSPGGATDTGGATNPAEEPERTFSEDILTSHDLKFWFDSVPQERAGSVNDQERERQEAINEVIRTEQDFVRDLEYIRYRWIEPLRTQDIIQLDRRPGFVRQVFWNIEDILGIHNRLCDLLTKRQSADPIIETIGDIFSELVPDLRSFVQYGKHHVYARYEFEKEKSTNRTLASFVEIVERLPESRKLELNGYLTKPTTRLARYPLLLEVLLKHTPEDNPDRVAIPKVVQMMREFLSELNEESFKAHNRFNLLQLDKGLVFRPGEEVALNLKGEQRQLVYKGPLKKCGVLNGIDLHAFLFDHALLMVRRNVPNGRQFKAFKKLISLEFLTLSMPEQDGGYSLQSRAAGYRFTISYLGRKGYTLTLWAATTVARRKWVEHITAQQAVICERTRIFDTPTLSEGQFPERAKVNCVVPYDHARRRVYGTDAGVYLQSLHEGHSSTPVRVPELADVRQIDVLEEYQLLVVLSGEYQISVPNPDHLLTIKTLEPIDQRMRGKNKPTFKKLLQGGNDTLKLFKEFYIPVESHSVHFLKTKLCIACNKGFEIVDLETLDTQSSLDPADLSLNFVQKLECVRPLGTYRIDEEFLLCYTGEQRLALAWSIADDDATEVAFYVNKRGWRSKPDITIYWEGSPTAFALQYPYIMALDPMFIEIRHVDDASFVQVIHGDNLRMLFADMPPSVKNSRSISSVPTTPHIDLDHSAPHGYSAYGQNTYSQYVSGNEHGPSRHGQWRAYKRDEIIIASDDKVVIVQPTPQLQRTSNELAPKV